MAGTPEALLKTGRWVVCATTPGSGVRHRFMMLSAVKHFADRHGYSMYVLWGSTDGVAHCRFEELFAPLPKIHIANVNGKELALILSKIEAGRHLSFAGQKLPVVAGDKKPWESHRVLFSWDLRGAFALAARVEGHVPYLVAAPAAAMKARIDTFARRHGVQDRIGIRIRVEECLPRDRKPHRLQRELDEALRTVIRLPWHTKVFVATDSHYIQTMLASHFKDTAYLSKPFDLRESTGAYVHRLDKATMATFLEEVGCLCLCRKIINIGGFLNERSVRKKTIDAPYTQALSWNVLKPSA